MAERVVRPGPMTVERAGVPVDVAFRVIDTGDAYEWLSPSRWHVLVAEVPAEAWAEDTVEAIDPEGVKWTFRPVLDQDRTLVTGVTVPATGFAAWLRRTVGRDELGLGDTPAE